MSNRSVLLLVITLILVLGATTEKDAKVLLVWLAGLSFACVVSFTTNLYARNRESRQLAESFDRSKQDD